jgi:hypothetical protein
MRYTGKEKLLILIITLLCVLCFLLLTLFHILNLNTLDSAGILIKSQISPYYIVGIFCFILLLSLLYYTGLGIRRGKKQGMKNSAFYFYALFLTFILSFFNPLSANYILSTAYFTRNSFIPFWDIIHFSIIVLLLIFLFFILDEKNRYRK